MSWILNQAALTTLLVIITNFCAITSSSRCDGLYNNVVTRHKQNNYDLYSHHNNSNIYNITKCEGKLQNPSNLAIVRIDCGLTMHPDRRPIDLRDAKVLNLNDNQLRRIPLGLFSPYNVLEALHISRNKLTSPRYRTFENIKLLKILDLSHNAVNDIGNQLLDNCPKLEVLNLTYNVITGFISGTFDDVPNMLILDVSQNDINYLDQDVFDGMKKLQFLSLKENCLTTFPKRYLKFNQQLEVLHIGGNPITHLPENLFSELLLLKELDISNLQLTTIPASVFVENRRLECLDASKNRLKTLAYGQSLGSFGFLNLSYNQLEKLNVNDKELSILDVSYNNLSEVQALFDSTMRLREVYLKNNEISLLGNNDNIRFSDHVEIVDVRLNRIVNINPRIINNKLRRFEIGGNPFECKCFGIIQKEFVQRGITYDKNGYFNGTIPYCISLNPDNCLFSTHTLSKYYELYKHEL